MVERTGSAAEVAASPATETQKKRLKENCEQFESVLTGFLIKSMRESVIRADEPDRAREVYENMMDESVAREIGRSGDLGLAQTLYTELAPLVKDAAERGVPEGSPCPETTGKKSDEGAS